ncbi:MAG: tRNA (guanosine(46)-N7)-methyltransferase TrmB [SAR324 cluster bacterium]|nr:tRNA (guanosine(46)-N7)-methyltransferase TrmB [SAR324 cluster bacterium]
MSHNPSIPYRPQDNRNLPREVFERRIQNNPYISHIYEYESWILPHPDPKVFQQTYLADRKNAKNHVELGCGSGQYLMMLSQQYPLDYFYGFEIRYKRIVQAARKLQKRNINHVLLIKDKAEYLSDYFSPRSIDSLHINFPDPWAKDSQKKHRLLNENNLSTIALLLKETGYLSFKTDHGEYFESVFNLIQTMACYQVAEYTQDLHQSQYSPQNIETEFEHLFKTKGNPPIFYMKIVRRAV